MSKSKLFTACVSYSEDLRGADSEEILCKVFNIAQLFPSARGEFDFESSIPKLGYIEGEKCYWNLETNGVKMPFRNKKCVPGLFPWDINIFMLILISCSLSYV